MPAGIILYTLGCYAFIYYVYTIKNGNQWQMLYVYLVFALVFGVSALFRWFQAFQYLCVCVSIPTAFNSIRIERYLKQDDKDKNAISEYRNNSGAFNF